MRCAFCNGPARKHCAPSPGGVTRCTWWVCHRQKPCGYGDDKGHKVKYEHTE